MSSNTLEIIRGLAQAAAHGYEGSHDERYSHDGKSRKVGLKREEGVPILDSRVNDGFKVKFQGDSLCITYQSDVPIKDVKDPKFEQEQERMINQVKKFLQREYKAITGNSVTLSNKGEIKVLVQTTSRVRTFVQASQNFKISKIDSVANKPPSEDLTRDITRKFLEQHSTKKPKNVTRKKD